MRVTRFLLLLCLFLVLGGPETVDAQGHHVVLVNSGQPRHRPGCGHGQMRGQIDEYAAHHPHRHENHGESVPWRELMRSFEVLSLPLVNSEGQVTDILRVHTPIHALGRRGGPFFAHVEEMEVRVQPSVDDGSEMMEVAMAMMEHMMAQSRRFRQQVGNVWDVPMKHHNKNYENDNDGIDWRLFDEDGSLNVGLVMFALLVGMSVVVWCALVVQMSQFLYSYFIEDDEPQWYYYDYACVEDEKDEKKACEPVKAIDAVYSKNQK